MDIQSAMFQGTPKPTRSARVRYAIRLETKMVKEKDFPYDTDAQFSSPQFVNSFCRAMAEADVEKFLVLYLTTKNRITAIRITEGTLDHQAIYPREVIKHALLSNAASMILVHNHPSGDAEPSPEDRNITKVISRSGEIMGVRVLDHIIIGTNGYSSFVELGMMP